MSRLGRLVSIAVIGLGIAAMAIGVAFVVEGQSKADYIKKQMRAEAVSMAALVQGEDASNIIDSAAEAQKVADIVSEHRHSQGTYAEVMALSPNGRYNPDFNQNPNAAAQLSYAQAINLENYLYLGVASLGLTTVTIVSGICMIVAGLGLALTGFVLARLPKKAPAA